MPSLFDSFPLPDEIKDGLDAALGVLAGGEPTAATTATQVAETRTAHVRCTSPAVADLVSVVAAVEPANGALTIVTQPSHPRKLQVRVVDTNSSISAGIVTIVGVGASGAAVTEAVTLVGGTATRKTTNVYATVTSATVSALAGTATGDTVGIGGAPDLGLPAPSGATTFAVFKSTVNNVNEAVGTVDATAGSIIATTAPDSSKSFDFWYTYSVTTTQNSHTHTLV